MIKVEGLRRGHKANYRHCQSPLLYQLSYDNKRKKRSYSNE